MKNTGKMLLLAALAAACLLAGGCGGTAKEQADGAPDTGQENNSGASQPLKASGTYEIRELETSRDGKRIYGEIYIPSDSDEKMPAVIFSHGLGGTHSVGASYAEALAARGYVVYCFDFCGGSPGSRSDGSTLEMSIFTEQADLEAVISMMQGLDYVDSDNLFLMGTSQGGAVSAITGAAHPEDIRGMVLLYPAFILVEDANQLYQSPEEIPDSRHYLWMDVGRTYFEPLLGYDIYGEIAAYDRGVLLIHGDADSIVPLSSSQRALEVYPSAELEVIPGAGHGFHGENARQATGCILQYLEAHRV